MQTPTARPAARPVVRPTGSPTAGLLAWGGLATALTLSASLADGAAPQPTSAPGGTSSATPRAAAAEALADHDLAPSPPLRAGGSVIADSTTLVYRAGEGSPGTRTLSDLGEEDARLVWEINRTRGTWTSYQLATSRDFGIRLFHPGFTITLPPPRRDKADAARAAARPRPAEAAAAAAPASQR